MQHFEGHLVFEVDFATDASGHAQRGCALRMPLLICRKLAFFGANCQSTGCCRALFLRMSGQGDVK